MIGTSSSEFSVNTGTCVLGPGCLAQKLMFVLILKNNQPHTLEKYTAAHKQTHRFNYLDSKAKITVNFPLILVQNKRN